MEIYLWRKAASVRVDGLGPQQPSPGLSHISKHGVCVCVCVCVCLLHVYGVYGLVED